MGCANGKNIHLEGNPPYKPTNSTKDSLIIKLDNISDN